MCHGCKRLTENITLLLNLHDGNVKIYVSSMAFVTELEFPPKAAFIMTTVHGQIHSLFTTEILIYTLLCLFLTVWASFYLVGSHLNPSSIAQDPISHQKSPGSNRKRNLRSYFDLTMGANQVLGPKAAKSDDFDNRKDLYKTRRDEFRNNSDALEELVQWKIPNHDYDYKLL